MGCACSMRAHASMRGATAIGAGDLIDRATAWLAKEQHHAT
ncbi:hypothetical protein [Burkholderia sp. TSV86]|nr:hypothetical protein [Burkholderia sp. TSV86]